MASNDIEFSGERKRVRCNEGLAGDECLPEAGSGLRRPGSWMEHEEQDFHR
jgi:hypothetical protein